MRARYAVSLLFLWVIWIGGCTTVSPVPESPVSSKPVRAFPVEDWKRVLSHHVGDNGDVDYTALAHDPEDLIY